MAHRIQTEVDLRHLTMEELERDLGSRLLADDYLSSLLEEFCNRIIDNEHERYDKAKTFEEVKEGQGVSRISERFQCLRSNEKARRAHIDQAASEY